MNIFLNGSERSTMRRRNREISRERKRRNWKKWKVVSDAAEVVEASDSLDVA